MTKTRVDSQGREWYWSESLNAWSNVVPHNYIMNDVCSNRGKQIASQKVRGCARRSKQAIVYACSVFGKATLREKVLRPGSQVPDKKVAICLGCPERK